MMQTDYLALMAERVGFEPTRRYNRLLE
ncbi:uncharacterized protein METZ01_LOCUS364771, partial [marine metagenome]